MRFVDSVELQNAACSILVASGFPMEQSEKIAQHLVLANLRGVDSHGVSRVEIYAKRLSAGLTSTADEAVVERETDSSILLNGMSRHGILNATEAIDAGVAKAIETGICMVGVRNSSHCGMMADYTGRAASQGLIAIGMTNAPANMPPWGGSKRYLGTNPFSYAIPRYGAPPIIFDMASSVVARGKIILAGTNGTSIPVGWALDKDGHPTTDPAEALDGVVLPVGGPKGYGIALMVEILSGILTGSNFGPHIPDLYKDLEHDQNLGHAFVLVRADLFRSVEDFHADTEALIAEIKGVALASGSTEILLPGEIEERTANKRRSEGIPLTEEVTALLETTARQYGVTTNHNLVNTSKGAR
ncbi:Ldh family oxidoreductase [Arthrobacter sp. EH-1B-1]|uniref:Ldh family oxidoreductase n=1 Tax=Arthrobacter vasquezii TaxID=2977629 RepID=A0ABT6CU99_9MICC|nr:Ldh family oxidoreductase [Arthrobacter vasquezii]MDF9277599.1 Ldh family oxidoreductase [Arthrobacter vasquezii]